MDVISLEKYWFHWFLLPFDGKIFHTGNKGKFYLMKSSELPDNADKRGWGTISTSAQPRNVSWGPQPTAAVIPSAHLPQLLPWKKYDEWLRCCIKSSFNLGKIISYRIKLPAT